MEKSEVNKLINEYIKWLKEKISFETIDRYVEITTPFLDHHNDRIQIYLKKDGNKILITDDGYTLSDLTISGMNVNASEQRKKILQTILNGFGVEIIDNQIITYANDSNFGQKKHNLIQSIMSINDMFVLSKPHVESLFLEDVTSWLNINEVRYSKFVKLTGKSGFDHTFDFLIPPSKKRNERLVKAINTPNKTSTRNFIWAFLDVLELRGENPEGIAILNDMKQDISDDVLEAFNKYDITSIQWTQKDQFINELVA